MQMLYDGDGNRVAKSVNNVVTRYLVDDLNPTGLPQVVEELSGAGVVDRTYTYGLQRISENQVISNVLTPSFYETDGEGSVRQLTNAAGAVTDSYEYDAFGNKVASTGTTPNNYLYRGEQYDPDLNLYYLRARYYNQFAGRFLNVDPLASAGERRYEYANADPVNGIDPSGDEAIVEFALLQFYPGRLPVHFPGFPSWCGFDMSGYLPGCGGGGGGQSGPGAGPGAPGGPPAPPPPCLGQNCHWTVRVNYRSILTGKFGRNCNSANGIPGCHLPIGFAEHSYVEIDEPGGGEKHTWGVLGTPGNKRDQEMFEDRLDWDADPLLWSCRN